MSRPDVGGLPPAAWNDTARPYRADVPVGVALRDAADRYADEPAVLTGEPGAPSVALTYRELYAEARRVAHLLRDTGCRVGSHVGVVGHHSPATVVGILGCLLAGATYVPIDPHWPVARRLEVLAAVRASAGIGAPEDVGWLCTAPEVREVLMPLSGPARENWRADLAVLWDSVARADRPAEAAGFNLSGDPVDDAEVERYARHVAALVAESAPSTVVEVGFGSGLVLRRLAAEVTLLSGIEPAPAAVAQAREWADAEGVFADFVEGFADEVAVALPGPHDVALLASVVQFFPDRQYLDRALESIAAVVPASGRVVVADVIPPGAAPVPGLLEIEPGYFEALARPPLARPASEASASEASEGSAWDRVEIRRRDAGTWPAQLGVRYDVVLHRGAGPAMATERPLRPDPGPAGCRLWSGWDIAGQPDQVPEPGPGPDDTAYVIFTSGSTGSPKGVRVGHRSVLNLLDWIGPKYGLAPGDQGLQLVSFCFDLSVYDVVGLLTSGAALRLLDERRLAEPAEVAAVLEREPITFWNSAPAALSWVLPFLPRHGGGRLRLVFLSGDWIPLSMPDDIRAFAPGSTVVSLGGATESTVWSNDFVIGEVSPDWPSIPYGRPMPNARYYVLDADRAVLPVGVEGDLYIAGDCLAQGYHDDPVRTAESFVADSVLGTGRMYRTGDRARWHPDGELEFLGRRDHQVKIRGFRVELAEIEVVLGRQPGVRNAVVVPVAAGGDRVLAAFYTPVNEGPGAVAEALRTACAARLPAYCVPTLIECVQSLPLTRNGKVDRAALAALAAERIGSRA